MAKRKKRKLRTGFTTGTAAAAAAKGALYCLLGGKAPEKVDIWLLNGSRMVIPIHTCVVESDEKARCTVIKDAGDDPDVTHRAEIGARVKLLDSGSETMAREPDQASVFISSGEGVGTVTKPGLEVSPGNPAINPGPLEMITRAVQETLEKYNTDTPVGVEVFVPKGKILAKKTLNARLGILGGISILGTTGIVKPLSHEAYVATIRSSVSVAKASGIDRVVLTTGRRSERYAQAMWPDLPETAFIQIGDYFRMSLEEASKTGFKSITLSVFFGKALKMAQGVPHTHAAKSSLTLNKLAGWTYDLTKNRTFSNRILAANTARHAFGIIRDAHPEVIGFVGRQVVKSAETFSGPNVKISGVIFDYKGNIVFDSAGPK